jgi:hypothetical protein
MWYELTEIKFPLSARGNHGGECEREKFMI